MSPRRSLVARLAEIGAALAGTLSGAALIRRLGSGGRAQPTAGRAAPPVGAAPQRARPPEQEPSDTPAAQPRADHAGVEPAEHPALPRPTYWPAALAFGITLLAWGFVTTFTISAVGLLVIFVAIGGWIGELLHEH